MANDLGSFLRAHRALRAPQGIEVVWSGLRRVAGLRREEVAVLAGVSVDYYARLEQGRERHPSSSVLEALSRALDLDYDGREHMFRLAEVALGPACTPPLEPVDPDLQRLMDAWPDTPAIIINRRLDLLATNALAQVFYADFRDAANLVRMTFLDPVGRTFFADWPRAAEASVFNLRLALGFDRHDRAAHALVKELQEVSPEFAELWGRGRVRGKTQETKTFRHRVVGEVTLAYHAFDVRSAPGQQLVVYQAEPGSASDHALRLLGMLSATQSTLAEQRYGIPRPA